MMKKSSGGGGRLRTDQHLLEENQRLKARIRELEQSVTASGQPVNVLSDGEARYRELIENSHDIIYTVNPDGVFTFVSQSWTVMLGHPVAELIGKPFQLFVHPGDVDACMKFLRNVLDMGQRQEGIEYRVRHMDGSWRWHMSSGVPIRDRTGKIIACEGVARDITKSRNAEALLKESESRYRALFEESMDGILITSPEGKFLDVNKAAITMFGYATKEEVLKLDLARDVYVNSAQRAELLEIARQQGSYELDLDIKKKGGEIMLVHLAIRAIKDEQKNDIFFRSVIRDITSIRKMEKKSQDTLQFLEALIDMMPSPIVYRDSELCYQGCNKAFAEFIGISKEAIKGKTLYDFYPKELADQYWVRDMALLHQPGRQEQVYEHQLKRTDGSMRDILFNRATYKNSDGTVGGLVAVLVDITERKQMEERLRRAEKMEALGTLAGGVAHDLNNVLGIVVGFAELLLRNENPASPIRSKLENIVKGGQRAAAIVDDLLTLARRGVVTGRQVINLNKIVSDVLQSPELEKLRSFHPNVAIKHELASGLLNISGFPVHLQKTLYNLLSNASEAMPIGGVLTIGTSNQYLDSPIHGYDEVLEGDYVVLSVSDTGAGIPAADLKRIFEPFYTKKVMGRSGTGLGLAVVWGTVKDHHGYINIQSEEGKGSTFTLYFPVTREDVSLESASVEVSTYMGNGETVLVVDDVTEQRELAVEMLRKLNYRVSSVSGGEEAISYVREHPVDLILLDMIMAPGIDGLETYRKIIEVRPGQKAIIVSGFAETERVKQAQELGAGPFVRKPYILENIGLAVSSQLSGA